MQLLRTLVGKLLRIIWGKLRATWRKTLKSEETMKRVICALALLLALSSEAVAGDILTLAVGASS